MGSRSQDLPDAKHPRCLICPVTVAICKSFTVCGQCDFLSKRSESHPTLRKQKMKLSNTIPTENEHVTYTLHTSPDNNQSTDTTTYKAV